MLFLLISVQCSLFKHTCSNFSLFIIPCFPVDLIHCLPAFQSSHLFISQTNCLPIKFAMFSFLFFFVRFWNGLTVLAVCLPVALCECLPLRANCFCSNPERFSILQKLIDCRRRSIFIKRFKYIQIDQLN